MSGRGAAPLTGVLVTGGALALAHLLAAVSGSGPGPVEAVAEAFIDLVPPWLKDLAVAWFGTADKVVLGVGVALVTGGLAALAGQAEQNRRGRGGAVVLALALVAALATLSRPDGGLAATWPVVVAGAVGALGLVAAFTPPGRRPPGPRLAGERPTGPRVLDRRELLIGAGGVAGVALAGAGIARAAGPGRTAPAAPLPAPTRAAARLPAAADLDVPGLTSFVTPNQDFYRIDTAFFVPRVDAADWRLRVRGMVAEEVELGYDDLLAAGLTEAWVTLCCVSNEVGGSLVGNARWLGLPVRDVLARARPQPGADMVLSRSTDGFTASTPLEVLTDDRNALLAVGMNGRPLPAAHGYPVRMVVPGLYGYVSATKWVTELTVTRFADETAYWTDRGWSERGPVKLSSRIDVPRGGAVGAGEVAVAGVAWAQHTGIAAVEVRVDEGPWEAAELAAEVTVDTWRQWVHRWAAEPGEHVLEVRATDRDGRVQTGRRTGVVPDGATGWHRVTVRVE